MIYYALDPEVCGLKTHRLWGFLPRRAERPRRGTKSPPMAGDFNEEAIRKGGLFFFVVKYV